MARANGSNSTCSVSALSLLPNYAAQYLRTRVPVEPEGGGHPQIVPYQVFETADGFMIVACLSNRFWPPLCTAIGRTDLVDRPEYRTNGERVRHRDSLVAILTELFLSRGTSYWIERLKAADVPCAEIHPLHEVFSDPQVVHNHSVVRLHHPRAGAYDVLSNPISMSRTPPHPRRHAPDRGEHTVEVLTELGFSADEVSTVLGVTQPESPPAA